MLVIATLPFLRSSPFLKRVQKFKTLSYKHLEEKVVLPVSSVNCWGVKCSLFPHEAECVSHPACCPGSQHSLGSDGGDRSVEDLAGHMTLPVIKEEIRNACP